MEQYIDEDVLVELRQKVQDALLKSAVDYYEAERACCEVAVPQQWKDDRKKHTMNLYGDAKTIRLLMNPIILT